MTTKREGLRPKIDRIDPAPRLFMVLVRHSLGWFEQNQLSAALGVKPSQISMWERGERPIPVEVLVKTADLGNISRPLLDLSLQAIRSLLQASQGRERADQAMIWKAVIDLLPLLQEAADVILAPLRSATEDPEDVEELWARLERWTPAQRLLIVEEGEEYQTPALHERVLAESETRAELEPHVARELAGLAARIAELAVK